MGRRQLISTWQGGLRAGNSPPPRWPRTAGFGQAVEALSPMHQRFMASLVERLTELDAQGDEAEALRLIEEVEALVAGSASIC